MDEEWLKAYKRALGVERGAAAELAKALNVSPAALSKLKTQGSAWLVFKISRYLQIPPPRALLDRPQFELLAQLEDFRRNVDRVYAHKSKRQRVEAVEGEALALMRRFQALADQLLADLSTGKIGKIANSNTE